MENVDFNRDTYRGYDAVNYSKLSSLDKNPKSVNEDKDFSDGLRNGDVLDLLCFEEEKFHEKYYVSTVGKLPSDAIKAIIDHVMTMEEYKSEDFVRVARAFEYGAPNWKDDTIYKKIMDDGEDYIQMLAQANDRIIIDFETYEMLKDATTDLKTDERTKQLFGGNYQVPLLGMLDVNDDLSTLYKCLLDSLVEAGDKMIMYDLKYTSSSLSYFQSDFKKWRYYLQASLYSDIVAKAYNKPVDVYYVIWSSVDRKPALFKISEETLKLGRDGGILYNGQRAKGYKQLTEELIWHQKNDLWDYPYQYYKDNFFELDVTRR